MHNESLANISGVDFEGNVTEEEAYNNLPLEICFSLFAFAGILADIATIYIIFHYKRLNTPANILIANWAIANLATLLVAPSGYRIITVIDHLSLPYEFNCILFELGLFLHLAEITIVTIITIDWILTTFSPRSAEKCHRYFKHILIGLWSLFGLYSIAMIICCLTDYYSYLTGILVRLCILMIIALVSLSQLSRLVQKCRNRPVENSCLSLNLATSFMLNWGVMYLMVSYFWFYEIFILLAIFIMFSSGTINFIIMYCCHKGFQACLLQTLRRKRVVYDDNISEFEVNPDVQVSFHNASEELLPNAY